MSLSAKPSGSTLVLASSTPVLPCKTKSSRLRRVSPFPWPAAAAIGADIALCSGSYSSPLTQRQCSQTASFRATATPLSSSHSSRHARRAAVHTVVTPCPDRTAPRCTARSPAPPDCGAESDTTTADRPAPIMPTCSHRCDHSCAYDASTPPLTAGLPPTPRAHHLCDHVLHPGRVSSHFDDYPRRRGGPRTSVQFTRGMVKGGCSC